MTHASAGRPWGVLVIAIFFAAAACVLVGVSVALAFPGSQVEGIWRLYPARRAQLMPYRSWLIPGFLALAIPMALASIGCFRHRCWGWRLAVTIFAVNGLGDAAQLVMGRFLEGGVGVAVASAILLYLFRPSVLGTFS